MGGNMRVLLADDHALFMEGLQNLLTLHGIQVVGTARNGQEAVEKTLHLNPDIVLMDINMPGCDGISATRLIKAERPECKVIMLTTSIGERDLIEAIRCGASGYLLKSLEITPFVSYLEGVQRGEAAISREMAGILLKEIARQESVDGSDQAIAGKINLTSRHLEIIQLLAQGLSYREAANLLSLSEHTVKYHMHEIMQRLQQKNREQVVAYAIRTGLVKKPKMGAE
jgi:DNA-binding NarL/FixJ family response regulator